ncbi:MAG: RHS repeat-associated core domain-containing protein [Nanoarchaeota archaeon]
MEIIRTNKQKERTILLTEVIVSIVTNESGNVVEQTFYDPYGAILSGGSQSRYNYEGKEFSSVTEDYDYNFRKYNPEFGIFTQPDALIPNVYDPQSLNRYRFERNNPYKYVDEDGKFGVLESGIWIVIAYFIAYYTVELLRKRAK